MWAIDNRTRFSVDRAFARDRDGAEVWVVAVRAAFIVQADGTLVPQAEQPPVCVAPEHLGDPAGSSLRYEMDTIRTKPGTDVILHATAHAPSQEPAPYVDVGFAVGRQRKGLRVYGDRVWTTGVLGLGPGRPEPFVTMPICYERALGGPQGKDPGAALDPANPVGVGRVPRAGAPVPNCELPEHPITSPRARGRVAGFGPIACHWEPRVSLAGTYDERWMRTRRPLLPEDFDDAHYRCAPVDQQIDGYLRGTERVVLLNLTPEGRLEFSLPRVRPGFRTWIDDRVVHHEGRLHTVILEPDDRRVIMVWHTALPCHHTLYTLQETTVIEKRWLSAGPEDVA